ncbi:hypothetical protein FOL47_000877, partial [Perkinsus chesapeaki]
MASTVELPAQIENRTGQDMVTAVAAITANEAPIFETPATKRQRELLRLRMERGRVQGRLNNLREMMKNIYVPEGDEVPQELVDLGARESLQLDHLARVQAEIDEMEGAALSVALRSSHNGSALGSSRSKKRQECHPLVNNQADDLVPILEKTTVNSPPAASIPPRGGSAPAAFYSSPQAHLAASPPESPLIQLHDELSGREMSRAHILSGSRVPDSACVSRDGAVPKGVDPSRLKLPKCTEALEIATHFEVCENVLVEARVGTFIMEGKSRHFRPYGDVQVSCIEAFLRTLPEGPIYKTGKRVARKFAWSWPHLRHSIVSRYGRRSVIKSELDRSLRQLKFTSPAEVDDFLEQCEAIITALEAAYGNDSSETRRVVKHIVGTLPPAIATDVIKEIKQTVGFTSASHRRVAMDADWELLLPFAPSFDPLLSDQVSISDIIRDNCRTIESGDPKSTWSDRVAYAGRGQSEGSTPWNKSKANPKSDGKAKIPLSQWAKSYAIVYVIQAQGADYKLDRDAITRDLSPDEAKFIRGKKKPLVMVAYKIAERGKEAVEKCSNKPEYSIRPFQFDKSQSGNEDITSASLTSPNNFYDADAAGGGGIDEASFDKVCSLQLEVPPELTVHCDLISSKDPSKRLTDVMAICDPGAGRSYWILADDCEAILPTETTTRWVELADGSRCSINRKVEVHLALKRPTAPTVGPVEFLVLPYEQSRVKGNYRLLIGRDLGGYLGLQLDLGTGTVSIGVGTHGAGKLLDESSSDLDGCDILGYVGVDTPGV